MSFLDFLPERNRGTSDLARMKVESYKVSATICKECKKQEQVDWKAGFPVATDDRKNRNRGGGRERVSSREKSVISLATERRRCQWSARSSPRFRLEAALSAPVDLLRFFQIYDFRPACRGDRNSSASTTPVFLPFVSFQPTLSRKREKRTFVSPC